MSPRPRLATLDLSLSLGTRCGAHRLHLALGAEADGGGGGLGLVGAPGEDRLGLAAEATGLLLRFAHRTSDLLLSLGDDLARGLASAAQHPRRLLAERLGERLLIECDLLRRGATALELVDAPAQLALGSAGRSQLGAQLLQERADLSRIEPPPCRGERMPGDVVSLQAGL